jgi:hypothetical protein
VNPNWALVFFPFDVILGLRIKRIVSPEDEGVRIQQKQSFIHGDEVN